MDWIEFESIRLTSPLLAPYSTCGEDGYANSQKAERSDLGREMPFRMANLKVTECALG